MTMIDVNGKKVFLCGPMTGRYAYNVAEFAWAHKRLNDMGADTVFDPAYEWYASVASGYEVDDHGTCMAKTIKELTATRVGGDMHYDMLVTLDGWKDSEGTKTEVEVARACGIPVYELQDVVGS